MNPQDQRFKDMLNHRNVKSLFESSVLFSPLFQHSPYADGGFWKDDIWCYDDEQIQEYFQCFNEGFVNGIVDYYVTNKSESEDAIRRMQIQMHETDNNEEIVLDFSEYFKKLK